MLESTRGQNTVEYILLLAIIFMFIIASLSPNGFFARAVENSINMAGVGVNSILDSTW